MADLFGLLGLALATPHAAVAVAVKLTQLLYVQGFLGGTQDHHGSS